MAEANKERIYDEFVELVSVPCHTLKERKIFELLQRKLQDLGFTTQEDGAGKELGGECGNLWGWLPGNKAGAKRVLLTAHMDCVEPCEGIKPCKKDGKIVSDGTTILGSDDKSGVVAILEAVRMLNTVISRCCLLSQKKAASTARAVWIKVCSRPMLVML